MSKLLAAGWKSVSLVDVVEHPSFTLWLCGCNLMCPFCHNWRIAERDSKICKWIDIAEILEEVVASRFLVDYLHVTGGEPLMQYSSLRDLLTGAHRAGLMNSLNSNLTLPVKYLAYLVEAGVVDHVATDLKIPPSNLFGLPEKSTLVLWRNYLESLKLIMESETPLELRIPLHKGLTVEVLRKYLGEVLPYISRNETIVVLNQLIGEPFTNPRNPAWCREYCGVGEELVKAIVEALSDVGFKKIVVRSIPGFT
ncbi:MAG: anaerobic ribonucleoside-triphosphate reductase activating protein [Thermosphaera sp.]|nr:anaerobic ribonucleoside-triphosphate reductase activating protein [Thermosphaera sp.]